MRALLIGSISTLVDTSELQRAAFNAAFAEAGLDWRWSGADYRARLARSGGRDRIAAYAAERGETVDAEALHARKTALFQESLQAGNFTIRPTTADMLDHAARAGIRTAFCSTTARGSIDAVLAGISPDRPHFDLVTSREDVQAGKPDPEVYHLALRRLDVAAEDAVAVEDNPDGVRAARAAGIATLAYPNVNTEGQDFGDAAPASDWRTYLLMAGSALN